MVPQVINFGFVNTVIIHFGITVGVILGGVFAFWIIKAGIFWIKSMGGADSDFTAVEESPEAHRKRFESEGYTYHAWDSDSIKPMSTADLLGFGRYDVIQADDGLYTKDK